MSTFTTPDGIENFYKDWASASRLYLAMAGDLPQGFGERAMPVTCMPGWKTVTPSSQFDVAAGSQAETMTIGVRSADATAALVLRESILIPMASK